MTSVLEELQVMTTTGKEGQEGSEGMQKDFFGLINRLIQNSNPDYHGIASAPSRLLSSSHRRGMVTAVTTSFLSASPTTATTVNSPFSGADNEENRVSGPLTRASSARLVAVLYHLASTNVSTIYDMLKPRVDWRRQQRHSEAEDAVDESRVGGDLKGEKDICDNNVCLHSDSRHLPQLNLEKAEKPSRSALAIGVPGRGGAEEDEERESTSTGSLLGMVLPLFSKEAFADSESQFSQLAAFVDVVTTPLQVRRTVTVTEA